MIFAVGLTIRTWRTSFSLLVPFSSESGTLEMTISASATPACDKRIGVGNVVVMDLHPALLQRAIDVGVEVDDANLLQQRGVPPLQLGQERAGDPVEAQQQDAALALGLAFGSASARP